jgi:predicted ATPase
MGSFINRVRIKNFKSIAYCDVKLEKIYFLVGPNGSGKSNFLDALRLTRDALTGSLDYALRDRGGLNEVRRKSGGHPTHFGIRIDFEINKNIGHYAFEVGAKSGGVIEVQREQCFVTNDAGFHYFDIESGKIKKTNIPSAPRPVIDRLFLVTCSGIHGFRPIFDALSNMGFYNLNPKLIRELQSPQDSKLLKLEGENLASVLGSLAVNDKVTFGLIQEYLGKVVPAVHGVEKISVGPKETLLFRQDVGLKHPWQFYAQNMSDGTLRALGILTALFQTASNSIIPLVGIEEPEVALHPAAAKFLREALFEASESVQIIVTSHSPELLDDTRIMADQIGVVAAKDNATIIAPADGASRAAMREHLYSAGELLKLNQLHIDSSIFEKRAPRWRQPSLFGSEIPA